MYPPNQLLKAYPVTSLEYKLIYHALCSLAHELEGNPVLAETLANEAGTTTEVLHGTLEALYTDNPDPDNEE
jgi:hypothetical protein